MRGALRYVPALVSVAGVAWLVAVCLLLAACDDVTRPVPCSTSTVYSRRPDGTVLDSLYVTVCPAGAVRT